MTTQTIDTWEVILDTCNLCGADDTYELWRKDSFRYCQCKQCGLVYVNPHLSDDAIVALYAAIYTQKSHQKLPPVNYSSFRQLLGMMSQFRKLNTVLDVGCFHGYFLNGAKQDGWKPYGTEISTTAAEFTRSTYGIDVHVGSILDSPFKEDAFDVVTMLDVIEHLTDPSVYLKRIAEVLRPGGMLYIETPNFNSVMRYVLGKRWSLFFPWHNFYFTPSTLGRIASQSGLAVSQVRSENWGPISTANPYDALNPRGNGRDPNPPSKLAGKVVMRLIDYRRWVKPYYMAARRVAGLPIRVLSMFGIDVGSKLILIAEKEH